VLEIDVNKVGFIIAKAREFETKEVGMGEDSGVAHTEEDIQDEEFQENLIAHGDEVSGDSTYEELKSWIEAFNDEDQCQVVALTWIGRGDFTADDWDEALRIATEEHNDRTAEYLLGMPLLPDYLEEGLSLFNLTYDE